VLLTADVRASTRFYTEHRGFEKVFESDWYVSLKHLENPTYELAIISHDHETIPEGYRRSTSALLLNFEVPSVESEYERLRAAGVKILQPLRICPPDRATSFARPRAGSHGRRHPRDTPLS
jgi:catechol 2,3-dioxygenase-like lactoylglutathione lyase family enzyme